MISTITVRAPRDVHMVASWSPCDMYNRTGTIQTGVCTAPAVCLFKCRAFGIIIGRKEDDGDEDAVNTCSRCEAGQPKAAAVPG